MKGVNRWDAIGIIFLVALVGYMLWAYLFPQSFVPHQTTTILSEPTFENKYVRHLIPNKCIVDIEPIENQTLLYVRFTIASHDGTIYTQTAGVQNDSDALRWESPSFTVNLTSKVNAVNPGNGEIGWIECNVSVKDSAFIEYSNTTKQSVGYALLPTCNTTNICNLTSGVRNARGYYAYDTVELAGGQNFLVIGATGNGVPTVWLNASTIRFYGNITQNTTNNGADVTLEGLEIQINSTTLSGAAGNSTTQGTSGYDSGKLTFYNFMYLYTTGTITLNAGTGGTSTGGPGNGGGSGGDVKGILFAGNNPGIVEWNATTNLFSGSGGGGDGDVNDCGDGGDGGSWVTSGQFVFLTLNDRFNHYAGHIFIFAGSGGAGGVTDNYISGCDGRKGGSAVIYFPYMIDNRANITVRAAGGGSGGLQGNASNQNGDGGDGGDALFHGASNYNKDNNTGFSYFNNTARISFINGNGGNRGTGGTGGGSGRGYCFKSDATCTTQGLSIVFKGLVEMSGSGFLEYVKGVSGTGRASPTDGEGWQYYYNSAFNTTNIANWLSPVNTSKSSAWAVYNKTENLTIAATGGMIRYNNLSLNATTDAYSSNVLFAIKNDENGIFTKRYSGNQTADMHGFLNGSYAVTGISWNNYSITERKYSTFNVSYIPTDIFCFSSPSSLINLSVKDFDIVCLINNSVDDTPLFLDSVRNTISGNITYLEWDGENYTTSNSLYFSSSSVLNWSIASYKTDYTNSTFQGGNVSFQKIIVELPSIVSDVKTICVFPTISNVKPYGQTNAIGIFRVVNLDNVTRNVSIKLNQTLLTGISQGYSNLSTTNWSRISNLTTSFQEAIISLPPFDNTQNVSNYSVYRWLLTNCYNVSVPANTTSLTNYRTYTWRSILGTAINISSTTDTYGYDGITGMILSSFDNSSNWKIVNFTYGFSNDSSYYRVENGTGSLNLNWTSNGTGYIEYNFTG